MHDSSGNRDDTQQRRPRNRRRIGLYAWPLIAWLLVLTFNLIAPSVLNSDRWIWKVDPETRSERIERIVNKHNVRPVFQKRFLTTALLDGLKPVSNDLWLRYVMVEFGLLLATAFVLLQIGRHIGLSHWELAVSQLLYFTSPTILFANFSPIVCFDEPIQFLTFLLAVLFTMKSWPWRAAPLLLLALFARETTLLLIPGLLVLAGSLHGRRQKKYWASAGAAIAVYFGTLYLAGFGLDDPHTSLIQLIRHNFGSWRAFDTVLNVFIAVGVPGALVAWTWCRKQPMESSERALLLAFAVAAVVNYPMAFAASIVSELRHLALPLIFVWPVLGRWFRGFITSREWRSLIATQRDVMRLIGTLVASVAVTGAIVFTLYLPSYLTAMYRMHALVILTVWVLMVLSCVNVGTRPKVSS
jgi:hypothetical protein